VPRARRHIQDLEKELQTLKRQLASSATEADESSAAVAADNSDERRDEQVDSMDETITEATANEAHTMDDSAEFASADKDLERPLHADELSSARPEAEAVLDSNGSTGFLSPDQPPDARHSEAFDTSTRSFLVDQRVEVWTGKGQTGSLSQGSHSNLHTTPPGANTVAQYKQMLWKRLRDKVPSNFAANFVPSNLNGQMSSLGSTKQHLDLAHPGHVFIPDSPGHLTGGCLDETGHDSESTGHKGTGSIRDPRAFQVEASKHEAVQQSPPSSELSGPRFFGSAIHGSSLTRWPPRSPQLMSSTALSDGNWSQSTPPPSPGESPTASPQQRGQVYYCHSYLGVPYCVALLTDFKRDQCKSL